MKKLFSVLVAAVMMVTLAQGAFASENDAMVRIVHASPDAPAVDVYVNGEAVVEGAEFKAATDYLSLPAGDHEVEIYAAGTMGSSEPVISTTLSVEAGMAYTAAAANMLENLELVVAQDSMEVTEGMTKVRVGHLSPDAPAVDVGLIEGDSLFSGAEFKAITDYTELDAGTYDLEIRTPEGDQVLDLSGTTLDENTVYSVFAVNTVDQLEVLVLKDYTLMPGSMPETGMGGAAQQQSSVLPITLAAVLGGAALVLITRKNLQK
ncbi:DUF4397 domain-containing protein [Rossellomorea vietnamensis]|uniref:DUF4397 domain-containing protein n=1 Tax=Rossellomorea vietnamensis TaxID=218284 RepID=A0A5D4MH89_9BACI|nr:MULTISPECIES: DUF4397 domain-containing protein [Bacillaceae]TYS01103.1 DUF4397 domain-containing protein [Rossellomorea vietnamensis]